MLTGFHWSNKHTNPLVTEECVEWDPTKAHVTKHLENFCGWPTRQEYTQTKQKVACRDPVPWYEEIAVPSVLLLTLWIVTGGFNNCFSSNLCCLYSGIVCLTDMTELEKKQQMWQGDDVFWFRAVICVFLVTTCVKQMCDWWNKKKKYFHNIHHTMAHKCNTRGKYHTPHYTWMQNFHVLNITV